MTAIAAMLSRADRERLLERLHELRDLDREMRAPGSLAAPSEPLPLHRAGRGTVTERDRVANALPAAGAGSGHRAPRPA